ncbi:Crp/Fnr family transcriptional regulator [Sphingopyxis sp. EG6]|uniref:Crp/Fnr family transcriptional regulator n=1 Tax=Sphingopyxis sp. EG6 TaxID=1874061 RepID=UPI000DC63DB7|nr:Crp/Fnr family transcriptional regulator [Sphingopyxis sp. EG6]BBB10382.1 cyclic nucleotide-binding protein [Sphingopyxis sp. EG6]
MQQANARVPMSETIVPDEIRDILLAHARPVRVRKGHILIAAGLDANDVFLVCEGRVQVSLLSPQGRETIIREIGPGQIFGELAAIDGEVRSANVTAIEPSQVAILSGTTFVDLIGSNGALARWVAMHLTTQIRFLTARVYELSTMSVGSRLQCELMRLCLEHGIENDQATIENAPTHADLAARIGTNRESVTRELGLLAEEAIVYQAGRRLHILAVGKLGTLVRRLSAHG